MTLIRLPVAPSTNNLFIGVGKKRIVAPAYRQWRQSAGWAINLARVASFGREPVEVAMMVPENSRRDLDNYWKAVLDLIVTHRVIEDDRFVRRLTIERHKDADMLLSIVPFQEHT